jgi:hypothetical protein
MCFVETMNTQINNELKLNYEFKKKNLLSFYLSNELFEKEALLSLLEKISINKHNRCFVYDLNEKINNIYLITFLIERDEIEIIKWLYKYESIEIKKEFFKRYFILIKKNGNIINYFFGIFLLILIYKRLI